MTELASVTLASLASGLLLGCAQPSSVNDKESVEPVESSRASSCRPSGDVEPLLTFAGARCEWVLLRDASGLRLRSLEADTEVDATGVVPESCLEDRCLFEGVHTELGPLVLALESSAESEMPAGVHLGVIEGKHLRFVDLWAGAGESVHGDATQLGPAFALAPHACQGHLALFVQERFEIAGQGEPPQELLTREGRVVFDGDEPSSSTADARDCVAIEIGLP
jgi:hypothetical protein